MVRYRLLIVEENLMAKPPTRREYSEEHEYTDKQAMDDHARLIHEHDISRKDYYLRRTVLSATKVRRKR